MKPKTKTNPKKLLKKKILKESFVEKAWQNVRDPGGLASLTAFAKSRKNAYDLKDLDKKLSRIEAYSMHRPVRRSFTRPAYIFHGPNQHYCADLIQMTQYKWYNSNYAWILVVMDSFSKVLCCVAMKTKGAEETALAIKKALIELSRGGRKFPEYFFHDSGLEFLNSKVKAVLAKYKIKQYVSRTTQKSAMCERLIKTIKSYIFKYFTLKQTKRWLDILPLLVTRYNDTVHSSHGMKPNMVNLKTADQAFSNMYGKLALTPRKPPKYDVGTLVRISKGRILFRKGYLAGFSSQVFRIKSIKPTFPVYSFVLETLQGEEVASSFTQEELSEVTP